MRARAHTHTNVVQRIVSMHRWMHLYIGMNRWYKKYITRIHACWQIVRGIKSMFRLTVKSHWGPCQGVSCGQDWCRMAGAFEIMSPPTRGRRDNPLGVQVSSTMPIRHVVEGLNILNVIAMECNQTHWHIVMCFVLCFSSCGAAMMAEAVTMLDALSNS